MNSSDFSHRTNAPVSSDARTQTANRRLQDRMPIDGRVLVSCEDRQGVQRRIQARAINTSKTGLLLQSDEPVANGTVVSLRTLGFAFIGRACVRHCTQKGIKYNLGLYVPDRLVRMTEAHPDRV